MGACTSDTCLPTKKTIIAAKEIIEPVFLELRSRFPDLSIDETYTLEDGNIAPKRGIFPSAILTIPANAEFEQPMKIMLFINVLDGGKKEAEISGGWSFGPGADGTEENIYIKLLEVVFQLKQEKGSLFKGALIGNEEKLAGIVRNYLQDALKEYKEVLELIG